ncbi:hypothetical protein D9611_006319 [Ephemerocybe angulata]|uniref:EXPERA domain-containing protein n=1 Tax=Ephemerocybe angulata TaxID=980116 RepID=A0A8H5C8K4_9AGAR|nr:hypothetical protein D9611_006319 [Tulosesus angulatus]
MIIDPKAQRFPSPTPKITARPVDFAYFIFFLIHIPATLLLDLQAVYPTWLVPRDSSLRVLGDLYMKLTADPVVGSVGGYFGDEVQHQFLWLRCFMWTELLLQLPTFIYGSYNLYHNTNLAKLYPLLIAYGAGTAMTTLPCIAVLLTTPADVLADWQRLMLLGSYIPFFVIPLTISIDMGIRTKKHLAVAQGQKNK